MKYFPQALRSVHKDKNLFDMNAMEGSLAPDISVKIYAYFQFSKPVLYIV